LKLKKIWEEEMPFNAKNLPGTYFQAPSPKMEGRPGRNIGAFKERTFQHPGLMEERIIWKE